MTRPRNPRPSALSRALDGAAPNRPRSFPSLLCGSGSPALPGNHRQRQEKPHISRRNCAGLSEAGFERYDLRPELVRAIPGAGFRAPRPIQVHALPAALAGRGVRGLAQTGPGNTAVRRTAARGRRAAPVRGGDLRSSCRAPQRAPWLATAPRACHRVACRATRFGWCVSRYEKRPMIRVKAPFLWLDRVEIAGHGRKRN